MMIGIIILLAHVCCVHAYIIMIHIHATNFNIGEKPLGVCMYVCMYVYMYVCK